MDALPDDLLSHILELLPDNHVEYLEIDGGDEEFGGFTVSSRQAAGPRGSEMG